MSSTRSYRASFVLALAAGLLLSSSAYGVEVFTTPEARKKWEDQQAADIKAKKERDKADKAHKKANQQAKDAGLKPLPEVPPAASQPSPPSPPANGNSQGSDSGTSSQSSAKASKPPVSGAHLAMPKLFKKASQKTATEKPSEQKPQEQKSAPTAKNADAQSQGPQPTFSTPMAPSLPAAEKSADAAKKPAQQAEKAATTTDKKHHFWRTSDNKAKPSAGSATGAGAMAQSASDSAKTFPGSTGSEPRADIPKTATEATSKTDKTRAGRAPTLAWINSDTEPKAVLLCVHGLGLHNKSYEDFGKRMAAQGVATYAVDVRGFGSWMNQKGTNQDLDFDYCLYDVAKTLEVLHKVHPGLKVFLLGESMGGAIALRVCAKYPELVDGLISCVPSGDRFGQKRTELQVALRFLHGANKQFNIGQSVVDQASKGSTGGGENEELKKQWLSDDFNRKNLSPKQLIQFQHFMNENKEWAKKISDRPVMMLQGDDDNLVKATGTLDLLTSIPVQNHEAVLLVIRDAKHLIFEEAQSNDSEFNNKVLHWVNGFIDEHLKKPQAAITQAPNTP